MEINLNKENFKKEVLEAELPVLVDFWAPWCGPCQVISPYIEELAKKYENKIKICKLNVDEAIEIATKYMVMSIPTLIIFKNGDILDRKVGAIDKEALENFIKLYITT